MCSGVVDVIHRLSILSLRGKIILIFILVYFQLNPSSNVEPGAGEIVGTVLLILLAVTLIAIIIVVVVVVAAAAARKCKGRHKLRSPSVSGQGTSIIIILFY